MPSEKIYIIEPQTYEEARALKAFVDAMKLKYKITDTDEIKNAVIADLEAKVNAMKIANNPIKKVDSN